LVTAENCLHHSHNLFAGLVSPKIVEKKMSKLQRAIEKSSLVLAFSCIFLPLSGIGAAINVWDGNGETDSAFVIEGEIVKGDYQMFINLVRAHESAVSGVFIYSPGGDFEEAMKIGNAIRELELGTTVPWRNKKGSPFCGRGEYQPLPTDSMNCICASACFFVYIGGVERAGGYIAVHRPHFVKGKFGKLTLAEAKNKFNQLQLRAKNYMKGMGIVDKIQITVLGTASDDIALLSKTEIRRHLSGKLPARHEWLRNKCSELSPIERRKLNSFSKAASEYKLKKKLRRKRLKEEICEFPVELEGRQLAFEKFFRKKPLPLGKHSLSDWYTAVKYLNKRFDRARKNRALVEGQTPAGKDIKMGTLTQKESLNSPSIFLSDAPRVRKRVIKSISISKIKPSERYTRAVQSILSKKWGLPQIQNEKTRKIYRWKKKKRGFEATLKLDRGAYEYLNLSIEICCEH